ncbi:hypothetical protein A3731_36685 [Roseovarius sp. HI0049]|nr:hypothetical protein A3731_36685 [Roseovarius sp. HI0049]
MNEILDDLSRCAEQKDNVTLGQITESFGHRGFGPFLIVPSLIELTPGQDAWREADLVFPSTPALDRYRSSPRAPGDDRGAPSVPARPEAFPQKRRS